MGEPMWRDLANGVADLDAAAEVAARCDREAELAVVAALQALQAGERYTALVDLGLAVEALKRAREALRAFGQARDGA